MRAFRHGRPRLTMIYPHIVTLSLLFLPCGAAMAGSPAGDISYGDPRGWQWYTVTPPPDDEDSLPESVPAPMTPSEEKQRIQAMTEAALDTAILYPSPPNIRRYRLLQDFWTEKATDFTQGWKKTNLLFPELDYNLRYSHYNGTVSAQQATDRETERQAVSELAGDYGVFFFYRGKEPVDNLMAIVMKNFSEDNRIAVVPVTMDGEINPAFPHSRKDNGQAEKLDIRFFPALYLVDPKSESARPLAYGFLSQDDLMRRFYNVATDFKANF